MCVAISCLTLWAQGTSFFPSSPQQSLQAGVNLRNDNVLERKASDGMYNTAPLAWYVEEVTKGA